ncbi:MAG TPA: GNAT family protein [Longimicrobium sp.]|nr:GNAT family protein [Longimicrobium sp.]
MDTPFLTGDLLHLRPHSPADLDAGWNQWFNDPAVTRYMYKGTFPTTRQDQAAYLERLGEMNRAGTHLQLAVVDRETGIFGGVASLSNIDWVNRSAEIAIVMGVARMRTRPHSLEAMALLLHHGFATLRLNRIWAGQHVGLRRWKGALERHFAGVTEGVRRQAMFKDGRYHDVVVISTLAADWWRRWELAGGSVAALLRNPAPAAKPDAESARRVAVHPLEDGAAAREPVTVRC